jgi:hypothetical protein
LTSVTRIAWPLLPWSDCGSDDALLLLPVPDVLLGPEVPGVDSDMGVLELLLELLLELGEVELADVDPLGLVLDAELVLLAASHVPFTSILWPT